jgi:hypothetical protein
VLNFLLFHSSNFLPYLNFSRSVSSNDPSSVRTTFAILLARRPGTNVISLPRSWYWLLPDTYGYWGIIFHSSSLLAEELMVNHGKGSFRTPPCAWKASSNFRKVLSFRKIIVRFLGLPSSALAEAISRLLAVVGPLGGVFNNQGKSHPTIVFVSFKPNYTTKSNSRGSRKASYWFSHLPRRFNFRRIRLRYANAYSPCLWMTGAFNYSMYLLSHFWHNDRPTTFS